MIPQLRDSLRYNMTTSSPYLTLFVLVHSPLGRPIAVQPGLKSFNENTGRNGPVQSWLVFGAITRFMPHFIPLMSFIDQMLAI